METEELRFAIEEYDKISKIKEGIIKIAIFTFFTLIIIAHLLGFTKGTIIEVLIKFIGNQLIATNLANVAFIGIVGGLFFLSVPLEALFITAIINIKINPGITLVIMILGLFVSYSANYFMGKYMSGFATKLVSPTKFYKIKILLNKYGKGLIFIFNVLPLPSQILTLICGVFKYNKLRYFSLWLLAWTIKLTIIVLFRGQIIDLVNLVKGIII